MIIITALQSLGPSVILTHDAPLPPLLSSLNSFAVIV